MSFIYGDKSVTKKERLPASRRVLCGGCRMVYVTQRDNERARCVVCKKNPEVTYYERRDNG